MVGRRVGRMAVAGRAVKGMAPARRAVERIVMTTTTLASTAGLLSPAEADALQTALPPDTLSTVFDGDTIPGMGAVGGVTVDALGFVYVADFRNTVWRYTPEGRVEKFAEGFYGASGNAIGPQGELYQSSFTGGFISRVSRDGVREMWVDQGLTGPVGIAVGNDGELYVCDCTANTIVRVGPDRAVSVFVEGSLFACPNGITRDDQGNFYVVNFGNTGVVRITSDGVATSFTNVPGAGGNGHIAFARGGFYVTKFRGHQVYRVEVDGSYRVVAGTGTQGESDGPALTSAMSQPNGIAAAPAGDVLYVNDLVSGNGVRGGAARSTLRQIRLITLTDVLVATEPGSDAVTGAYRMYRQERPGEDTAAEAVALGYQFLSGGRVGDALVVFALNAEDHPTDANSVYQLGEAYRYTGQPERAIEQYRRVLQFAPDHALAAVRLEALGG